MSGELDNYIDDVSGTTDAAPNTSEDVAPSTNNERVVEGNYERIAEGDNSQQQEQRDESQQQQSSNGELFKQQKPEDQQKDGAPDPKANLRPLRDGSGYVNDKGDIVDKDGGIIATSGMARRMHEQLGRARARVESLENENNQLRQQASTSTAIQNYAQKVGLEDQDVIQALDYTRRIAQGDVGGVAKDIVTFALSQGVNLTDIVGNEVGDSVEMRAMRAMLAEQLQPVTSQAQAQQQAQQTAQQVRQQYVHFIQNHPHADQHEEAIANLHKREGITLSQAYTELRVWATRHGLDFSQPLGPQIEARRKQGGSNQQQPGRSQKPMPNGAITRGNGTSPAVPMADPNDSWDKILRETAQLTAS